MTAPGANGTVCGFGLADRVALFCGFGPGNRIADIGCGNGGTAKRLSSVYGVTVCGIDRAIGALACDETDGVTFHEGSAECMPFDDGVFDGVLFECCASLIDGLGEALAEAGRVMSPGGYLALGDFFVPGGISGALRSPGRLESLKWWSGSILDAGFSIELVEDRTETVREYIGQMIFDFGASETARMLECDEEYIRRRWPDYFLMIARKADSQ